MDKILVHQVELIKSRSLSKYLQITYQIPRIELRLVIIHPLNKHSVNSYS